MGTTVSGIRVPTTGDVFDVPGDMLRNTTDLVAALASAATINGKLTRGLQIQAMTGTAYTNPQGDVTLTFPTPFASPPPCVVCIGGDITPVIITAFPQYTTASVAVVRVFSLPSGNPWANAGPLRFNMIVVGTPL